MYTRLENKKKPQTTKTEPFTFSSGGKGTPTVTNGGLYQPYAVWRFTLALFKKSIIVPKPHEQNYQESDRNTHTHMDHVSLSVSKGAVTPVDYYGREISYVGESFSGIASSPESTPTGKVLV